MKKILFLVAMLIPLVCSAESTETMIARSCSVQMETTKQAKVCTILQVAAMERVLALIGTPPRTGFLRVANECVSHMPHRNDWLYVEICIRVQIHDTLYGVEEEQGNEYGF